MLFIDVQNKIVGQKLSRKTYKTLEGEVVLNKIVDNSLILLQQQYYTHKTRNLVLIP